MKKVVMFFTGMLLVACSSDDGSGSSAADNSLVTQTVFSYSYGYTGNTITEYDDKNRDAQWTYSDIQLYRAEPGQFYSDGEPKISYTVILNPQGYVSEVHTKNSEQSYIRNYTYDNKGRVIQEEIMEQGINSQNGNPTTNPALSETLYITWDDSNNVISIKSVRPDDDYYYLTTFSDFSSKIKNTLKPSNFGFNFFGRYGYPAQQTNGGGNGGFYYRNVFGGEYLPAKRDSGYFYISNNEPYNPGSNSSSNITYQKDSKGKVTEVYEENVDNTFWSRYRYSY